MRTARRFTVSSRSLAVLAILSIAEDLIRELAGMERSRAVIGAIGTRFEVDAGIVPGNINGWVDSSAADGRP